jgi:hypothetical protein
MSPPTDLRPGKPGLSVLTRITSYDFLDASARIFKEQLTVSTAPANKGVHTHHV